MLDVTWLEQGFRVALIWATEAVSRVLGFFGAAQLPGVQTCFPSTSNRC